MNDRSSPLFDRLGRAVRWLRERQGKKQYLVADTAGVTKGMLSAYETGRQKPSLETLEKLLTALDCDLHDLHNAIQIVNERPEGIRRTTFGGFGGLGSLGAFEPYPTGVLGPRLEIAEPRDSGGYGGPSGDPLDVGRLLGIDRALEEEERRALEEIVAGCHRLVRHLHRAVEERSPRTAS
ncbi:MAG TPA: helix-turn-helix transcriptional regulator [Thermoanaerobaculia bacterium]|nr:helix-turn-helix transcriptional regulator [Thermoanaerobaculia bacterium]